MTVTEHIAIDRDPLLALEDARNSLDFALMNPAALSRAMPYKRIKQLELALTMIKNAMGDNE